MDALHGVEGAVRNGLNVVVVQRAEAWTNIDDKIRAHIDRKALHNGFLFRRLQQIQVVQITEGVLPHARDFIGVQQTVNDKVREIN